MGTQGLGYGICRGSKIFVIIQWKDRSIWGYYKGNGCPTHFAWLFHIFESRGAEGLFCFKVKFGTSLIGQIWILANIWVIGHVGHHSSFGFCNSLSCMLAGARFNMNDQFAISRRSIQNWRTSLLLRERSMQNRVKRTCIGSRLQWQKKL